MKRKILIFQPVTISIEDKEVSKIRLDDIKKFIAETNLFLNKDLEFLYFDDTQKLTIKGPDYNVLYARRVIEKEGFIQKVCV